MATYITFVAPFLHSSLPPYTKIRRPRICFRVKTTGNDNQYDIYYRTCADVSFMLEGVEFTESCTPVSGIRFLCIIIAISSAEGLIILVLDIFNDFHNTILTNPEERFYLSLTHRYLDWYKIKCPKHPLAPINQKYLCIQVMNSIQLTQPAGKFCYDLLKSISITIKMTRSSFHHAVFSWV